MKTRHRFLSFAISTLFGVAAFAGHPGAALAANAPCPWNSAITCATYHYNPDIFNQTNSVANDWHIHFRSVQGHPLHISQTFEVGQKPFPHANTTVTGDGTSDVTINYSGTQLNVGDENHNGANIVYQVADGLPLIVESYWTLDGAPIGGSQHLVGLVAGGNTQLFTTTKTDIFADAKGTQKVGTVYATVPGSTVTVVNAVNTQLQPGQTVFAQTAMMPPSTTEIPLEQLNSNLDPQFPPPGPLGPVSVAVPAVPPWGFVVLATGLLGMGLILSRRLIGKERAA
jgi:hypothetical protein